jgi:hypothetical protein
LEGILERDVGEEGSDEDWEEDFGEEGVGEEEGCMANVSNVKRERELPTRRLTILEEERFRIVKGGLRMKGERMRKMPRVTVTTKETVHLRVSQFGAR